MINTYVDIHVIQTVPPSNINRDDTGSPKTAIFGGVRRARVSSQAWKRAIRKDFVQFLDSSELGERSRNLVYRIADRVRELAPEITEEDALKRAANALKSVGIKTKVNKVSVGGEEKEDRVQTEYLLFLSRPQIDAVATLITENLNAAPAKKDAKKALTEGVSIDVALFGRMIADAPDLNCDACCQVAHALSVNAVDNEFDYFTAVDDNGAEDNAGAGMIGTVEFNSSTLYRYATVNATELTRVLGSPEASRRAVEAFIRAFVTSMPTGKQNTFANRTLPEAVLVTIRDSQPINLVSAFENPISDKQDRPREAVRRMLALNKQYEDAYGASAVLTEAAGVGTAVDEFNSSSVNVTGFDELTTHAGQCVADRCKDL